MPIVCQICNKTFKTSSGLAGHIQLAHGQSAPSGERSQSAESKTENNAELKISKEIADGLNALSFLNGLSVDEQLEELVSMGKYMHENGYSHQDFFENAALMTFLSIVEYCPTCKARLHFILCRHDLEAEGKILARCIKCDELLELNKLVMAQKWDKKYEKFRDIVRGLAHESAEQYCTVS